MQAHDGLLKMLYQMVYNMVYLSLPDQQSLSSASIYLGGEGIPRGCRKEKNMLSICLLCNTVLQLNPAAITVALRTACPVEDSTAGR